MMLRWCLSKCVIVKILTVYNLPQVKSKRWAQHQTEEGKKVGPTFPLRIIKKCYQDTKQFFEEVTVLKGDHTMLWKLWDAVVDIMCHRLSFLGNKAETEIGKQNIYWRIFSWSAPCLSCRNGWAGKQWTKVLSTTCFCNQDNLNIHTLYYPIWHTLQMLA